MSDGPPEDPPKFVTEEPGLDPVSGRPWGEETPGKRVASYSLLAALFTVGWVYLLVDGPGTGRGQLAIVLGPIAVAVFALLAWRAIKEYRSSSDDP